MFENAAWTSTFQQLLEDGVELPAPEELSDEELTTKLGDHPPPRRAPHVLSTTNHLSDRELYAHLWSDVFHERTKDMPFDPCSAHHIDLLSTGSDEDTYLYLKHFADEKWRTQWLTDFPDYEMPEHVDPPYDRDRLLPKATYGDVD
jgi:hypothetical protein